MKLFKNFVSQLWLFIVFYVYKITLWVEKNVHFKAQLTINEYEKEPMFTGRSQWKVYLESNSQR